MDDPTFLQSRGSINVDDEGVEPQRSVLIENGVLRGYLQDRLSAKHFGVGFTGNGRRENFACAPMPRMTNTVLLAGPHDPEEILASVKRGIYAKTFGGGQVDISNGDFVFSLTESYLVEDGKLTAPLKGVNLIGNGPETLRDVTMLGNGRGDLRWNLDLWQGWPECPRRSGLPNHQDCADNRWWHRNLLNLPLVERKASWRSSGMARCSNGRRARRRR
ncbi:MAG: metallopeptidase TldD-related protein [Pseudomonadota bacterium]